MNVAARNIPRCHREARARLPNGVLVNNIDRLNPSLTARLLKAERCA